jgi:hypothetical protein
VTVKVAPAPGAVSSDTAPPWASTMAATMARPRPAPPVSRVEGLEHPGGHVRFEPRSVVRDAQARAAVGGGEGHPDLCLVGRVSHGVAQEVGDDLVQLVVVAAHVGRVDALQ